MYHPFTSLVIAQLLLNNMSPQLDDVFNTHVFNSIKQRLVTKGLSADLIERSTVCFSTYSLLADYDKWHDLLHDPLFVPSDTFQRLLRLKDSSPTSPQPAGRITIFYIRTFTLTVSQLQHVLCT